MCGLTGYWQPADFSTDAAYAIAVKMANALVHRGPDDAGVWLDEPAGIALAFARLSILDLSPAGHQPMVSATGRFVIVFNGEIYNHLLLRSNLEQGGNAPPWRGHSDTETLLAGFEAWGIEKTLKKTVGMFAIALWDRDEKVLTLARDRIGEKPLYYGFQKNTFLFGSELKALRKHPDFIGEIDRDVICLYLRYCYIPAPFSIYKGIQKLLPGNYIQVPIARGPIELCSIAPIPYWSLAEVAAKGMAQTFAGTDVEALAELEIRIFEAIASQQISDVPLGAFLSGGIDSSTIVALMQAQSSRPIHTFTIGFDEQHFNEAVYAKSVARNLGTDHTEWYVSPEEALSVIPRLPTLYDEPFADPSQIPTFLVSQLARRSVTVSLSGDAGDELFGGYNRYTWAGRVQRIPLLIRKLLAGGFTALSPAQWDKIYAILLPLLPRSLQIRMPGDKAHKLAPLLKIGSASAIYKQVTSTWTNPEEFVLGSYEPYDITQKWDTLPYFNSQEHRMMFLDALTYLPDDILCKVDRAAMGVSLETRVPFLDHRVVEYAWQLPLNMKIRNGQSKWILRQLLYKYVPKELIERPKMGFGVPIDSWLRGPLKEWAEELLNEYRLRQEGYINPVPIRKKWAEHLSGKLNWQYHLWSLLMFEAWYQTY